MDEELIIILLIIFAVIGSFLLMQIFFLLTLQKALNRCSPRNRTMSPAMVWLDLIPIVQLVWQFITVIRVSESLRNEFRSRGMHRRSEDYGYGLGIATYCVLAFVGLPGLIMLIMYWRKIASLSARIAGPAWDEDDGYEDEADDDHDRYYHDSDHDRPRRRRGEGRPRGRSDGEERPRQRDDEYNDDRKPWEHRGR